MKCPGCNGLKQIKLPAPYTWSICPTCEGEGELPDRLPTKWCPACGEPIKENQEWCGFHAAADSLNSGS